MSQKKYVLISTLITAAATVAVAVVTYLAPSNATAINGAIEVIAGAAVTVCGIFKKAE